MTTMNHYFLKRQVQIALYGLKRQYGGAIVIYRRLSSTVDTKTGQPTVRSAATRIPRAVILPAKTTREVERNISLISANKQMVMGGGYDSSKRVFIIERRDAPSLVLTKDDWIAYDGRKFAIESIEDDLEAAWVIVAKHLVGEAAASITLTQSLSVDDGVGLQSQGQGEV
jgi:hypothetical protein